MSDSNRIHAAPSPTTEDIPQLSLAEKARTLLHIARLGTLSTLSRKHPGFPFGSLMPYVLDGQGSPVFLISSMAVHTQNLRDNPHASLLVAQPGVTGDPLGSARVTLLGQVAPAGDEVRELYLKRYENAQYWGGFSDFAFMRLLVEDVYFIGGFGIMGWVSPEEYRGASPDPLADAAPRIIEHMNGDHAGALLVLARVYGGVAADEARMTAPPNGRSGPWCADPLRRGGDQY